MEEQTRERFVIDSGIAGRNSVPTNSYVEPCTDKLEEVEPYGTKIEEVKVEEV